MSADYQAIMNEVARQMAASQLSKRQSRSSSTLSNSRRPARIEKPRSIQNSPRNNDRRRTVTAAIKRYSNYEEGFLDLFDFPNQDTASSRPLSWHPGFTQYPISQPYPVEDLNSAYAYATWMSQLQAHSQPTPQPIDYSPHASTVPFPAYDSFVSMPEQNAAFLPSGFNYSSNDMTSTNESYALDTTYSEFHTPMPITTFDMSSTEPFGMSSNNWSVHNWVNAQNGISSAAMSPDALPIQHPTPTFEHDTAKVNQQMEVTQEVEEEEDDGKELVGMGLYDGPKTSGSWLLSGDLPSEGKGLKLEESWEPPPPSEDGDNEDEEEEEEEEEEKAKDGNTEIEDDEDLDACGEDDDDASSSEDLEDSPPEPAQIWNVPQHPVNLSGQSFFFEGESGNYVANDNLWLQQQSKQFAETQITPSMSMQQCGWI